MKNVPPFNKSNQQFSIGYMILLIIIAGFVFMANAGLFAANPSKKMDFRTVVDGPHVFYKGSEIIVKNFMLSENLCQMTEETFTKGDFVSLFCKIDPAGQIGFKFPLRRKHDPSPSVYPMPEKIFAISDIEGNFSAFASTLKSNGVINDRFSWNYGEGHLVLVGDFVDRGEHVTAVLWLIYKLELEAKKAGGKVHFIIGNHEEMNVRGDDRFVVEKYKRVAGKMNIAVKDLYGEHTELGRWLRSKNFVEKIGNTLFAHGGISPEFAALSLSLEKINKIGQAYLGQTLETIQSEERSEDTPMVFAKHGPLWYRGYFKDDLTDEQIKMVLDTYEARRIVVGHTIVEEIAAMYNGKIYPIDVKHASMMKSGGFNAIIIHADESIMRVNPKGKQEEMAAPKPEEVPLSEREMVFKAINDGDFDVLNMYLTEHDINDKFAEADFTLLHIAIECSNLEVIDFLIKNEADPDVLYNDKTVLMYAIKKNDQPVIKYLLEAGVDVEIKNKRKQTALFYAAKYSTPAIAELIIDNGGNIYQMDLQKRTARDFAEETKNIPVASYLKSLE